jgi:hypothetical protein
MHRRESEDESITIDSDPNTVPHSAKIRYCA